MDEQEKIVRHLEMIQGIIDRMGRNSFMLKGWAVVLIAASVWLLARSDMTVAYAGLNVAQYAVPFAVFWLWLLDGYFLRQERLFRKVYDKVRKGKDTDFSMNPSEFLQQVPGWLATCFGWKPPWPPTLLLFYAPIIAVGFLVGMEGAGNA